MSAPTLVILAAGMGSRYGGLKQVVPVNEAGESIVDYSVYDAVRAGFGKVVFVIRKDIEEVFKQSVGVKFERKVEVAYAFQEPDGLPVGRTKPWGTLQATLVGAELVDEPFAVINADDFYGAGSFRVLAEHLRSETESCAMVGFELRKTLSEFGPVSRGVCRVQDGLLLGTVEMTKIVGDGEGARSLEDGVRLSGDEIVSMNMWGFMPGVVGELRGLFREFLEVSGRDMKAESYLPEAVNRIVRDGVRVDVLRTEDVWCGITYPEDYEHVVERLRELTRQVTYPERLWS